MSVSVQRRNLLVFVAREPAPGLTKTRLGQTIGMERAAALYRAFLIDLDDRFRAAALDETSPEPFDLCWAYTPESRRFPMPAGARSARERAPARR